MNNKSLLISIFIVFLCGLIMMFVGFFIENNLKYKKVENEIIYVLPKIMMEVNDLDKTNQVPKSILFRRIAINKYNYSSILNKKGNIRNVNGRSIFMNDSSIISFYQKKYLKDIERKFLKNNLNLYIKKTCTDTPRPTHGYALRTRDSR